MGALSSYQNMTKLDDKGEKKLLIIIKKLINYIYNPYTNKFIIIHIVIFYEIKFWTRCNHGVKQNIPIDLDGENDKKKKSPWRMHHN